MVVAMLAAASSAAFADQWTTPTKEELSMTSLPQAPGAAAIYLFREETQQDYLHMYSQYVRLKVLAEGGNEKANVELKYGGGMFEVTDVEKMLANGMEVKLLSLNKLEEYEEPLSATLLIKGPAGSATGKRIVVTGDLFQGSAKPTFAHEKRDLFVSFPTATPPTTSYESTFQRPSRSSQCRPKVTISFPKWRYTV